MRWLFVIGISFDLAGAALVVWTISIRSPAETREEALSVFGSNFWIVLFREREQAHVRAGLGLLGLGFVLQLAGYVTGFSWPTRALALFVAAAVACAAFVIARTVSARTVPIELSRPEERDAIRDERYGFGLATFEDVLTWRRLYARRIHGRKLRRRQYIVSPRINGGSWTFRCPECGPNYYSLATPGLPTVVCSTCSGEFPARFPQDRAEIERLLLKRPKAENRTWEGQTLEELRRENEAQFR
jgi:hypothetical protein